MKTVAFLIAFLIAPLAFANHDEYLFYYISSPKEILKDDGTVIMANFRPGQLITVNYDGRFTKGFTNVQVIDAPAANIRLVYCGPTLNRDCQPGKKQTFAQKRIGLGWSFKFKAPMKPGIYNISVSTPQDAQDWIANTSVTFIVK